MGRDWRDLRVARCAFGLAACLSAVAVSACGEPGSDGSGRTITIGISTEPEVLLPVLQASDMEFEINGLLYLTLNSAIWERGRLEYVVDDRTLSERWEFSDDSLALTYHLRRDAVWSDGHPIDSEDVVFTFDLISRPELGSPAAAAWEQIDSVVPDGSSRVRFHFKRRYPGMLFDTGVGIIPEHLFGPSASDVESLVSHRTLTSAPESLVVSGPYRVSEWRRDERLVLEPNPHYLGPDPSLSRVAFRLIEDASVRRIELENGSIDVALALEPVVADELAGELGLRVATVADRFYDFIAWNATRVPAFADPDVRRALSLGIDRQAILGGLRMGRYARPATGPFPAIFADVFDSTIAPDAYSPDSARALLAAHGWSDREGDEVIERDGEPFRFTLITQSGNQRREYAAQVIAEQLRALGIDAKVELLEFNTLLGLVFDSRAFDAVLMGWGVGLQPDYIVGRFWPADHPLNVTGYASDVLDSLIPLAQASATRDAAAPYWAAAGARISRERPYAFLWYFDDPVVLSDRIAGTRIDTYGVFQNLHHWTLAE